MTASAISTLITDSLSAFGTVALTVLTAVIGVAVAFFVYRWGKKAIFGSTK